jgi:hypothetical protein
MTSVRTITFARLRDLLLSLGFTESVVPKSIHGFIHADTETEIFLPIYRIRQAVAPHHLALVSVQLDQKGLLDAADFDKLVTDSAEHSASN